MAAAAPLLVHVESMQTAVPTRVAGTGRSLPIAVSGPPLTAEELQRRFRAVLYYRGAGGELEAAARERAAWVKESLSAALSDCPEMAGRLRRGGDGRLWEVKLKDTGVRLVHASVEVTVAAFLEASGADRERKEAALALWTDVDAHEPDICAPFILQLTRFLDGGYAVGVSCSLLLADPLSLIGFLESWARKHAELQAQGMHVANPVIQYTRYLQSPGAAKRVKSASTLGAAAAAAAADNTATTVLFRAAGTPDHRALAVACVGKACEMLGVREPPRFTVMDRDGSEGLNVQACACAGAADGDQKPWRGQGHAPRLAHWREAGLEDMELEGSKPVHVSYSVSPCADEGLVIVMPFSETQFTFTTRRIRPRASLRRSPALSKSTPLHYSLRSPAARRRTMRLASAVPCVQAFPAFTSPAAGSRRCSHTRLLPLGGAQAASRSVLACPIAPGGCGRVRWLPVPYAAGSGAVGDDFVTEGKTNVKFPRELTAPGYTDSLIILGTGYRDKFFVKVYAAAFYVDYSLGTDTKQWKEKIGIESFDDSSVFYSIFKAPVVKSLSIILVRDVDGKTFVNALNDVIARQIKAPNAEEESSLSTFQNVFLGRNLKQGTSIYLTWLEPARMLISISENQHPHQVDAEIKSATVNYALYDGFFGNSPVSPSLRSSTAQLLEALLT